MISWSNMESSTWLMCSKQMSLKEGCWQLDAGNVLASINGHKYHQRNLDQPLNMLPLKEVHQIFQGWHEDVNCQVRRSEFTYYSKGVDGQTKLKEGRILRQRSYLKAMIRELDVISSRSATENYWPHHVQNVLYTEHRIRWL